MTYGHGMHAHPTRKLGALRPRPGRRRAITLCHLAKGKLPAPPAAVDNYSRITTWPMMLNDQIGDCTVATVGHLIMLFTFFASGLAVIIPDPIIRAFYFAITNGQDTGAVEDDVLHRWVNQGITRADGTLDKIIDWCSMDVSSHPEVMVALWWFGGLFIGLDLPLATQDMGDVWDVTAHAHGAQWAAGGWGGHAAPVVGYDATGVYVVSWGQLVRVTWAFWDAYVTEAHAPLSPDYLDAKGATPGGLTKAQLVADLAQFHAAEA